MKYPYFVNGCLNSTDQMTTFSSVMRSIPSMQTKTIQMVEMCYKN